MKKSVGLLVGVAIVLSLAACGKTCPQCEKIEELDIRADELRDYLHENADYEGSNEYEDKYVEYNSITKQIDSLKNHDCKLPATKVNEKEYQFYEYSGTYSGDWKASTPNGEGTFEGKTPGEYGTRGYEEFYYSGEWISGEINGYGTIKYYIANDDSIIQYEGNFKNNKYHGSGVFYQKSPIENLITKVDGEFVDGNLISGEFVETNLDGEVTDYGTLGEGWVKITSAKRDAMEKRQQEAEQQLGEMVVDGAEDLWDAFWR